MHNAEKILSKGGQRVNKGGKMVNKGGDSEWGYMVNQSEKVVKITKRRQAGVSLGYHWAGVSVGYVVANRGIITCGA